MAKHTEFSCHPTAVREFHFLTSFLTNYKEQGGERTGFLNTKLNELQSNKNYHIFIYIVYDIVVYNTNQYSHMGISDQTTL